MARIGQIAVRLAAEHHDVPGRVAGALDDEQSAVHKDTRVRAWIVAEADAAKFVHPQLAAVDLHERTRAHPDGIAAGILRKKDVASRVDALVQVQDAAVHDDARGRHLVRRRRLVAVAVADRRPVVEMHRAAVHLEDGALLLPAVRVRGVNRRAADPHGDGEAVVEVPGAGLHHHLAFEEREARHALRRAVAVRVRHVDAASVRLRESRAVARDPVRARAVERERAGTRLHEAALLPEELAGEREVVLDVERGRLLPAVEARDVAAEHAAVRSRVAERAGADEERAGAAERAERAVRDEARSFERAAHEVGVALVRVGGRERDDAAGAVVHEHVARAAERGDGERHAVARRERPRPFAERGVGRLPDDLVLAEDERVALRVVRDVAAARERRRGGGGERLARHHVLEADVVAALPREKVVDQPPQLPDLERVEAHVGMVARIRRETLVVMVGKQDKGVLGRLGAGLVDAREVAGPELLAGPVVRHHGIVVVGAVDHEHRARLLGERARPGPVARAVLERPRKVAGVVHLPRVVERAREVTRTVAFRHRPVNARLGLQLHELEVHLDLRVGIRVVAGVDGLRPRRLDVGVGASRRQGHHAGDPNRQTHKLYPHLHLSSLLHLGAHRLRGDLTTIVLGGNISNFTHSRKQSDKKPLAVAVKG